MHSVLEIYLLDIESQVTVLKLFQTPCLAGKKMVQMTLPFLLRVASIAMYQHHDFMTLFQMRKQQNKYPIDKDIHAYIVMLSYLSVR